MNAASSFLGATWADCFVGSWPSSLLVTPCLGWMRQMSEPTWCPSVRKRAVLIFQLPQVFLLIDSSLILPMQPMVGGMCVVLGCFVGGVCGMVQ